MAAIKKFNVNGSNLRYQDDNIASEFSSSFTYQVGDYVMYDGILYKCHTIIETAGDWTGSANWEQVKVGDKLNKKVDKSNIAPIFSSSTSYAIGDYVYYNSDLYRFTANHPAGAWTGTDVVSVALADGVSELQSEMRRLEVASSDIATHELTSQYACGISSSNGKWSVSARWASYIDAVSSEVLSITVTANSSEHAVIAFLKTNAHAQGDYPDYATGSGRTVISAGETKTFDVPQDCNYLYVLKTYDDTSYDPASVVFLTHKTIPDVDASLTVSGAAADAKATGDIFDTYDSIIYKAQSVDFESAPSKAGIIASSNGKWSKAHGNMSYFIPVAENYVNATVTAGANTAIVALLKTDTVVQFEYPDYATGGSRVAIPAGETQKFDLPSDCKYICVIKAASDVNYTPASTVIRAISISEKDVEVFPLGLHEMPSSDSVLNIVKRCRQMTDIKWTPAVDLKRFMLVQRGGVIPDTANAQNYLGKFKAGTEYTGVPYGRVSGTMDDYYVDYATVGHYIDFETFISSVSNENSKLCKEDVGSVSQHRSVIYATVCSGLTCYALDVSEVPTANIASISGLSFVGKINDNGTLLADNNFKIGDVLNKHDYHTAIITDIIRDNDGVIQSIELSDASTAGLADKNYDDGQIGGVCRRKGWSREQLFDPYSWGDYSLYRYAKNVPYTPSPYVNVGDEFDMQRIEHFPCMPYEGNKFAYKMGYIPNNAVKIIISLDGYAHLKVFKDGAEITGSPFVVTSETESIDMTVIDPGEYTAYLCNISDGDVTNLTYPCSWTIVE